MKWYYIIQDDDRTVIVKMYQDGKYITSFHIRLSALEHIKIKHPEVEIINETPPRATATPDDQKLLTHLNPHKGRTQNTNDNE